MKSRASKKDIKVQTTFKQTVDSSYRGRGYKAGIEYTAELIRE